MADCKLKESLFPYLTDILGIRITHWHRNLSLSQTIEKLDLATGRSLRFERMNARRTDISGLNLQVVINIGESCREETEYRVYHH